MRFSNWWSHTRLPRAAVALTTAAVVVAAALAVPSSAFAQGSDLDNDGVLDEDDNCVFTYNPNQDDSSSPDDGVGDACEDDADFDGVPDDPDDNPGSGDEDNCPDLFNPGQDNFNADDEGDACDNSDSDDILDDVDNCRSDDNPGQEDADSDGVGDACDSGLPDDDPDADGVGDSGDSCPSVWNPGRHQGQDADGDGTADACDPQPPQDLCPSSIVPSSGFQNPGFEAGPDGWEIDGQVLVLSQDLFELPNEGTQMARLGSTAASGTEPQADGVNVVCQAFTVGTTEAERTIHFAYNMWSYDPTGTDSFRFLATVDGDPVASVVRNAWGDDVFRKSSGWQSITLHLDEEDAGQTAVVIFALTTDNEKASWAYIDSADGPIDPPGAVDVDEVESFAGTVAEDPHTGSPLFLMPENDTSNIQVPFEVDCPFGSLEPPPVVKLFPPSGPPIEVSVGQAGGDVWNAVVQFDQIKSGDLVLLASCDGELFVSSLLGEIVLYDPSGVITDVDGDPVVDATVTLFNVPGWDAASNAAEEGEGKCQSNASRDPGEDWNMPAPVELAVPADLAMIMPAVPDQLTNSVGYYGWNVAAGCWFVTVEASGFRDFTSPVVGVPTAVTDLDLELRRSGGGSGPLPSPSPTGLPGGGSELPPEEIPLCGKEQAEVCGTKEADHIVIDSTDDTDGDGLITVHAGPGADDVCLDESAGLTARVLGGTGNDLLEVRRCTAPSAPIVKPALGPYGVKITALSVAHFFGGIGRDVLRGGGAGDLLNTGTGVDRVRGGGGADIMKSSRGRDILSSGDGNDWLYGGRAADILRGGAGRDQMLGGYGFDTCAGGEGREVVEDCESDKWNF